MSYQQVVKIFSARKKLITQNLLMDLKQLITPKNDDGSVDHRYHTHSPINR